MPYLVSPPAPPPIVAPSCETARCSQLSSVVSQPERSTAPKSSPSLLTVTEFSSQAGEHRADLLEPASAESPSQTESSQTGSIAAPEPARSTPIAPAPQPTSQFSVSNRAALPPFASTASTVEYDLNGADSKLTQSGETAVLRELNQAIDWGGVWGDFSALRYTPRKAGGSAIAQVLPDPDEETPILLPVQPVPPTGPTLPQTPSTSPQTPSTPPQSPVDPQSPAVPSVPPSAPVPAPTLPPGVAAIIELTADRQTYDSQRQIFTAEGRVLMRFQGALLDTDRLQVNLANRLAVAEGSVALTRGNQVLRGQRLEYNFVQGSGTVLKATGTLFLPSTSTDLLIPLGNDISAESTVGRPTSDRISAAQPVQGVTSSGGISTSIGVGRDVNRIPGALPTGGTIRRLRYEADRVDFTPEESIATNIQLTNDPFSPPELVLKADRAKITRVAPLRDELRATRPRLVFDQRFTLPIPLTRLVFNREEQPPPLVQFGYDSTERGGLFVERTFTVLSTPSVRLTIAPQFLIQRAFTQGDGLLSSTSFGVRAKLRAIVSPRTTISGRFDLPTLKASEFGDELRASLRARQFIGTHQLAVEYSYRDRLFNGSLGFQTVQTSLGAILTSPQITLGQTGITLTYQAGYQFINATTDRADLLKFDRKNDRTNLSRFQASAALTRGFLLWSGRALPATREQGLKYTPVPVVPYVSLGVGLTGVFSAYGNRETQRNLLAGIGLGGQFGNFSRPFLDYTAFNISYNQVVRGGDSPFLFDRIVDNRILSLGLTQQIYGPFRFTIQTAINLDTRAAITTDYILEYSRRTYGIILRYNPTLAIGSLNLRISDFNWTGGSEPFSGVNVTPVEGGIIRTLDD
ncbi:MAG TPA: DUF3769 domain-containing protein [Thermosynechococcaceae cyanobacterium]